MRFCVVDSTPRDCKSCVLSCRVKLDTLRHKLLVAKAVTKRTKSPAICCSCPGLEICDWQAQNEENLSRAENLLIAAELILQFGTNSISDKVRGIIKELELLPYLWQIVMDGDTPPSGEFVASKFAEAGMDYLRFV